ncbi:MAG: extracellular solute-binding protein [Rhizobiaceae bacterium]|nr:extracellular solute-binding protein [Rhizobiaceae bacterium]
MTSSEEQLKLEVSDPSHAAKINNLQNGAKRTRWLIWDSMKPVVAVTHGNLAGAFESRPDDRREVHDLGKLFVSGPAFVMVPWFFGQKSRPRTCCFWGATYSKRPRCPRRSAAAAVPTTRNPPHIERMYTDMLGIHSGKNLAATGSLAFAITLAITGYSGDTAAAQTMSGAPINGDGQPFLVWTEGGSQDFQNALMDTYLKGFAKDTGFVPSTDAFCCGTSNLQQQVDSGNVKWSVLQFSSQAEFEAAKKAGLLEKLDPEVVQTNKLEPGSYDDYGFQTFLSAFVVGYLPASYPDASTTPQKFDDLFDTKNFPGKRCLYKYPEFNGLLEGALMADGVPPTEVYPIDINRAFARLAQIKSDIVWYDSGSQATQLLANGTCKMAQILNGVAQSAHANGTEITIRWDHTVLVPAMMALPKNGPNQAAGQAFLGRMISNSQEGVDFLKYVAYPLPMKYENVPGDVLKWAPLGKNLNGTMVENWEWYANNIKEVTDKFNNFLVTGQ